MSTPATKRRRLYEDGKTYSIFVSSSVWLEAKKLIRARLGVGVSKYLSDYLRETVARLKGESRPVDLVEYEELKRQHELFVDRYARLTSVLKKREVYDELLAAADEAGLDFKDISNLDVVVPKLFKVWKGTQEELHLFINLLEVAREKRKLERRLTELRTRGLYFSNEGVCHGEEASEAHSIQGAEGMSQMRPPQPEEGA